MGLKTMPARRRLAIIAHGDGQEVILDIGIFDTRFGADKGTSLELVAGPQPLARQKPLRADGGLAPEVPVFIQRHRLAGLKLHIDFKVILQVRAHARTICHNLDPVFLQMRGRADP
jgi:hypothetical protein